MAKGLKGNGGLSIEQAERSDGLRAICLVIKADDGSGIARVYLSAEQARDIAQGLMAEASWAAGENN